jgi:triphosphoribosyl-dephospho-CoA synthetase
MARLGDTNLLHRGGAEGLGFAKIKAAEIGALPDKDLIGALDEINKEKIDKKTV